jgi:hypothetical protein
MFLIDFASLLHSRSEFWTTGTVVFFFSGLFWAERRRLNQLIKQT